MIDFAKRHFHFLAILQPVALSMPNVKVRRGSALPKLQDLPQLQDKYRRKSYPYLEKQRQTVNDDHQREAERTRVMEDIQFKNALLMNGILGEAIEFEPPAKAHTHPRRPGPGPKDEEGAEPPSRAGPAPRARKPGR